MPQQFFRSSGQDISRLGESVGGTVSNIQGWKQLQDRLKDRKKSVEEIKAELRQIDPTLGDRVINNIGANPDQKMEEVLYEAVKHKANRMLYENAIAKRPEIKDQTTVPYYGQDRDEYKKQLDAEIEKTSKGQQQELVGAAVENKPIGGVGALGGMNRGATEVPQEQWKAQNVPGSVPVYDSGGGELSTQPGAPPATQEQALSKYAAIGGTMPAKDVLQQPGVAALPKAPKPMTEQEREELDLRKKKNAIDYQLRVRTLDQDEKKIADANWKWVESNLKSVGEEIAKLNDQLPTLEENGVRVSTPTTPEDMRLFKRIAELEARERKLLAAQDSLKENPMASISGMMGGNEPLYSPIGEPTKKTNNDPLGVMQ